MGEEGPEMSALREIPSEASKDGDELQISVGGTRAAL